MNCPQCNAPITPEARFCEDCGTPLSVASNVTAGVSPDTSETSWQSSDPVYAAQSKSDAVTPPPSPYETDSYAGKHASASLFDEEESVFGQVKQAAAASAAIAVDITKEEFAPAQPAAPEPAAAVKSASTSHSKDPYAAAVEAAGGSATTYVPPQAAPVAAAIPVAAATGYAQPTYAEPVNYAQPTYADPGYGTYADPGYGTYAPPVSPYATDAGNLAGSGAFGLAIASLVIGIIGMLTFGIFGFFGVLGIIFAIIALVMRSGYEKKGLFDRHKGSTMGLSIAGIVTNLIAMIVFCMLLYIGLTYAEDDSYGIDYYDDTSITQILGEDA